MRLEWLRNDNTDTWACFEIYDKDNDNRVRVLAVLSTGLIDRDMTREAARAFWADLKQQGWHRASNAELAQHEMSHRALRHIAYKRRP
jgi:hypothetical protein